MAALRPLALQNRRPMARLLTGLLLIIAVALGGALLGIPAATLSAVAVLAIFVLSLDIVMGLAGVQTLGQAAMFGAGAYAAGLFATVVTGAPLLGLFVGAMAGAALAVVSAPLVLRAEGLRRIAITLVVAELCAALARLAPATPDLPTPAFLGMIPVASDGLAMLIYATAILVAVHFLTGMIAQAPLGLSLRALRDNPARMRAIGVPVLGRLTLVYAIGGAVAGLGGALHAQTTGRIGPEMFSLALSIEAVILLAIGGAGRIWGALAGTVVAVIAVSLAPGGDMARAAIIGALGLIAILVLPGARTRLQRLLRKSPGDAS